MKKIGMFKAMSLCSGYGKLSAEEREKLRGERLRETVAYARAHSPYYQELYRGVGEDFTLGQLPPTSKRELMSHWDEWVTDRGIKLSDVTEFMKNPDNIGRKLHKKYMVFTTSGSTGEPLVMLCDDRTNSVMGGVNAIRSFARREDMSAFIRRGAKTIGVFADSGFYLGNSSVRSRLLKTPWKKRQMAVTSALLPISRIVEQLNEFQPAMLGGYPSNLELLIDEQLSGRLHISPVLIMSGGEYLSDALRRRLAEAFGCYVQTSYSCTEGGTIACECREQHYHINDDWLIVEPVDKDNNPVADGQLSDKLLLTNLFNLTQPFIRYEITDRVIRHSEPCACGNPSPWLELEGRTDDVVSFPKADGSGRVSVPPLALYAVLKEVHELRRFQLLVHPDDRAELRLVPDDGVTAQDAFDKARVALLDYLRSCDAAEVPVTLPDEQPRQDAGSGKFKHIIRVK